MADIIITPEFIASFVNILKPRKYDDGGERYEIVAVFPVNSPQQKYLPGAIDLTPLKKAVMQVIAEKQWQEALKQKRLKLPLLEADEARCARYGWPEGSVFVRLKSKHKPGVVAPWPDKDGRPAALSDDQIKELFYPGCRARASIRPFAFAKAGSMGVSFALHNLQWLGHDERLGTGTGSAADEFESVADPVDDIPF
jgi:hypothetical protein